METAMSIVARFLLIAFMVYRLVCVFQCIGVRHTPDDHIDRPRRWCFGCHVARLFGL
jgi:hypothetical protein